jgi:hypothetical protein
MYVPASYILHHVIDFIHFLFQVGLGRFLLRLTDQAN